jgi:hypothetical protein
MAGVSALSLARGWLVPATSSNDSIDQNASQTEVLASGRSDSCYALQVCWPHERVRPNLIDPWWRRLDCFAWDLDDPRVIEILEERLAEGRMADRNELVADLADTACHGTGIVEVILSDDRPCPPIDVRSNNLLVDMIHLERARW